MRIFSFLIFIILISFVFNSACSDKTNPSKAKDCNGLDTGYSGGYCCYVESSCTPKGSSTKNEDKDCEAYTKEEYDKIEAETKAYKELAKASCDKYKYTIKCNSSYLKISLLGLLFILI